VTSCPAQPEYRGEEPASSPPLPWQGRRRHSGRCFLLPCLSHILSQLPGVVSVRPFESHAIPRVIRTVTWMRPRDAYRCHAPI